MHHSDFISRKIHTTRRARATHGCSPRRVPCAQVLFPTHFGNLAALHAALCPGRPTAVVSTRDFMRRYADLDATAAADGYNALADDFSNTSLLVSSWHEVG